MKRILIVLPVLVLALLLIAVIAPSFIDWSQYKTQAQQQVKAITGYDTSIEGDLGLSILPFPYLYIEGVTVHSPLDAENRPLAKLERLDVSLSVPALLQGKIGIDAVELVKPVVYIRAFEDGRQSWQTDEVKALLEPQDAAQQEGAKPLSVSLNRADIEDGRFSFQPASGDAFLISALNAALRADSLQGPFKAEGDLVVNEKPVVFEVITGARTSQEDSLLLNLDVSQPSAGLAVQYDGVVTTSQPFEAQGEATVTVQSVPDFFSGLGLAPDAYGLKKIEGKGILTASQSRIEYKDLVVSVDDNTLRGALRVDMDPLRIEGNLKADKALDLDRYAGNALAGNGQIQQGSKGGFLPETITLPQGMSGNIAFSAPGLLLNKQAYGAVSLSVEKSGEGVKLKGALEGIPGQAKASVNAQLSAASRSKGEDGAEIYKNPVLNFTLDASTQNVAQTVAAFAGNTAAQDLPPSIRSITVKGGGVLRQHEASFKNTTLSFNGSTVQLSGSYSPKGASGRPVVVLDAAADRLDFDSLTGEAEEKADSQKPFDAAAFAKSLSVPMDMTADIGVQSARLSGHDIKGLRIQGDVAKNALKITNISAQDFSGLAFKVEGGIADLSGLSGIDLKVTGKSDNIRAFAKATGLDVSGLPDTVNAASVSVTAKGDINNLSLDAAISALNGQLTAKGAVKNPVAEAAIDNLSVGVRHGNLAEALRLFAPSAPRFSNWNKPLELSADLALSNKVYSVSNLKGSLAGASVNGNMRYDGSASVPALSGALTFGDLVMITEHGRATGATASGAATGQAGPARTGASRWSAEPLDVSWMRGFNADLDLKANSLVYDHWNLKNAALKFTLRDGVLDVPNLSSGLFGGSMAVTANVQAPAQSAGALTMRSTASFKDVNVEDLVKGFVGIPLIKGQGRVNMDMTLSGSGASQRALVNALSGNGTMTGREIVLEGFDLTRFAEALSEETKPGDSLLGLWKGTIKGGSTAFETLDGAYTMNNGIADISKLNLDGPEALLATRGQVNLPAWTIQTAHTITLKEKPDVPPFTVNISGSLDNPGNTFAQGALNDYLSRKINRKLESIIGDKLGLPGLGGSAPPQAPAEGGGEGGAAPTEEPLQSTPSPEEAIGNVLKGLLSR